MTQGSKYADLLSCHTRHEPSPDDISRMNGQIGTHPLDGGPIWEPCELATVIGRGEVGKVRSRVERHRVTEVRVVCDTCGQHFGLFHKGCPGEWIEQTRFVTDWS